MLQGFWGPGCQLNTLIDLANIALASKKSLKAICFFFRGLQKHMVSLVRRISKSQDVFFSENRAPGVL